MTNPGQESEIPKVMVLDGIFHPNISPNGSLSMDKSRICAKDNRLETYIVFIHNLLMNPNPDDANNQNAGTV